MLSMRSLRNFAWALFLGAAFACTPGAEVSGTLEGAADAPVVVKRFDIGQYQVLDTVRTDARGRYSYKADVKAGEPDILCFFSEGRKIASLLVQQGDRIAVSSGQEGYTVTGSEESLLLQQAEDKYVRFLTEMRLLGRQQVDNPALGAELSRRYVAYYREACTFVMNHTHSLVTVPVLFQEMENGTPVFSQTTDAILFQAICDSLKTVYPDSRYVKTLQKEAERRQQALELQYRLKDAQEVGFVEIDLPGVDGKRVRLTGVDAKLVMLYFWSSTAADQKMFNLDTLLPLYEEYHGRGFEIFAVCLDTDKTAWATSVRAQHLPWINVCDIRGLQSPYIGLYGVKSLPTAWFLLNGEIDTDAKVSDAASLRKYLQSKL